MLRQPLNLPRGSEQDALEEGCLHVAAYDGQTVIGVGRLQFEADNAARVRYLAVHAEYQRRGIGSTLLGKLEDIARTSRLAVCWLYARHDATGFYASNGYVVKGKGNSTLSGLKHVRMEKSLIENVD